MGGWAAAVQNNFDIVSVFPNFGAMCILALSALSLSRGREAGIFYGEGAYCSVGEKVA